MRRTIFAGSVIVAAVCSYVAMSAWISPLFVLMANILLFGTLSVIFGHRIYLPSFSLGVALLLLLVCIVVYPRIIAFRAHTPQEHMIAARTLAADWRIPFHSERAAWPHYLLAAEGGIADAECAVGMAYLYRHYGAPFDRAQARRWLEAAASHGSIQAQRELQTVDTVPQT